MAEGQGRVKRLWAEQERRVALWAPVLLGLGVWFRIGGAWSLSLIWVLVLGGCAAVAYVLLRGRGAAIGAMVSGGVLLGCLGFGAAELRIRAVDAPVLAQAFTGEIEGRVIGTGRARSRSPRVLLDTLTLTGVHPSAVPARVRVTLAGAVEAPPVGARIRVTGTLGPPSGPAAPGAFDFSRQAFFLRIGAVGYARGSVTVMPSAAPERWMLRLTRLRSAISGALRERIGGEAGAVAAALIVGDRSEISESTTEALRDSGLAHLLAISGLHIGLMSALTFWLVRAALALVPGLASRTAVRKIAAVAGLAAAAGYLALAGFGVATQRAFIMAAVAFGAILIDRPAVTVRGLAAAAFLVLLLRPESLFEAGFQMSFAAVAALIAGFDATRPFWRGRAEEDGILRRCWTGLLATVATSVMAGAATAPFAAYHFNRLVAYGLPANVMATPLMGLWIMPAIILTAVLAPFGLAGVGLAILGAGIGYILWVAHWIAGLEGAAWSVPAGSPLALALLTLGGLWLVIWRGRVRGFAVVFVLGGVLLWRGAARPDVLIAEGARLIAVRGESGALWVSRERVGGYSADTWLRRDGDGDSTQKAAYDRRVWSCTRARCVGEAAKGRAVVFVRGRRIGDACQSGALVIAPKLFAEASAEPTDCVLLDRSILQGASAASIRLDADGRWQIKTAQPWRPSQ